MVFNTSNHQITQNHSKRLFTTSTNVSCDFLFGAIRVGESIIEPVTSARLETINHDNFDKTIVMVFYPYLNKKTMIYPLEIWQKIDNKYIFKKQQSIIYQYAEPPKDWYLRNFICTRQYYIIETVVGTAPDKFESKHEVNVYDKQTGEYVCFFWGNDIDYLANDYEEWWKESLQVLKTERVLKKLSGDLLAIILSYVG